MAHGLERDWRGIGMIPAHRDALLVLFGITACAVLFGQSAQSGNGEPAARKSPSLAILTYDPRVRWPEDCLSSSLTHQDKGIGIAPAQLAKNAFFPWLEESVLSLDPKQTAALLSKHMIHKRAREIDLRYLVLLIQGNSHSHLNGPFFCGAAGEGAGCLGGGRITRETTLEAIVLDLELGREATLSATARAHDLIVGVVLPLWIPGGTSTKSHACNIMALNLLSAIRESDAVPAGSSAVAPTASVWKSSDELANEATADEAARSPSCFDSFIDQTADAPLQEKVDSSIKITDGVQWFDGVSSVNDMVLRRPAAIRSGSIVVSEQFLAFAPTIGSKPDQKLRIPYTDLQTVTVDRGATTLVLLQTKGACRAAFQVLDISPSIVKQRTDDLGKLLTQRLANLQKHSDPAMP